MPRSLYYTWIGIHRLLTKNIARTNTGTSFPIFRGGSRRRRSTASRSTEGRSHARRTQPFDVSWQKPDLFYARSAKTMIDGLPTEVYSPVKERAPVARFTRNTVMASARWLQQYRNRPVGSKAKLRG